MADIHSVDNNRSFLDAATADLQNEINRLKSVNGYLKAQNMNFNQFIEEQHIEKTWEEYLLNKMDLMRVVGMKSSGKSEVPQVAVKVGEQGEEK